MIPKRILHQCLMFKPPAGGSSGVQILKVTTDPRSANYARINFSSSPTTAVDFIADFKLNNVGLDELGTFTANCVVVYQTATSGKTWTLAAGMGSVVFHDGLTISDTSQTGTVVAVTTDTVSGVSWACPATVGVVYVSIPVGSSFNGQTTSGDYIVAPGTTYTVDPAGGNVLVSYSANTLGDPGVALVGAGGDSGRKIWSFSNVFSALPSVGDLACLQIHADGNWVSCASRTFVSQNGVNTGIELNYGLDTDNNTWRINGSTAGLAFAGGGSLLTGVTGNIS